MARLRGDRAYEFARRFHALSVWKDEAFDADAVSDFLDALEANPNGFFKITSGGVVGGVLMPLWFAPSSVLAVELFWYAEEKGEGARLREAFEAWAHESGAAQIVFSALADERESVLRRVMSRSGYTPYEIGFRKKVS